MHRCYSSIGSIDPSVAFGVAASAGDVGKGLGLHFCPPSSLLKLDTGSKGMNLEVTCAATPQSYDLPIACRRGRCSLATAELPYFIVLKQEKLSLPRSQSSFTDVGFGRTVSLRIVGMPLRPQMTARGGTRRH